MAESKNCTQNSIRLILATVPDPEVPVLSVLDLGIIREIDCSQEKIRITLTPTYSGCPAMDVITTSIRMALLENGIANTEIVTILSPAWTTDWISEEGKQKLKDYGIAPPHSKQLVCTPEAFQAEEAIQCPRCDSFQTRLISRFGATPCKALYQCENCREPFDYFKCH